MTQYLLSVHINEGDEPPAPEVMEKAFKDVDALNQEMMAAGIWVFGGGLLPSSSATVVRHQGGEVLTTDGPFAETKEQLGGFWIIKVPDLDEALSWARRATTACLAPVEVRPFEAEPDD